MNEVAQVAAITLIMFSLAFFVGSLIGLMTRKRLPRMILTVRIEDPRGPVPTERVRTLSLVTGMVNDDETMASIWRKVDDPT